LRAGSRSWPRTAFADCLFLGDPVLFRLRSQIADQALKHGLPAVSPYREGADAGGLIAYGVSLSGTWRHAAQYVDKILKGAKPADFSVEQPTQFELVINLKTRQGAGSGVAPVRWTVNCFRERHCTAPERDSEVAPLWSIVAPEVTVRSSLSVDRSKSMGDR